MRKYTNCSILFVLAALLFSSCSGEDLDDKDGDALNTKMLTYIEVSDLVGHWNLSQMNANAPVDLNGDSINNTNLMQETSCFEAMNIHLKDDMTFTSVNSRMDFEAGESNNSFECMTPRTDSGIWQVDGDVLTLKVNIAGTVFTHTKVLTLGANTFSFDVTKEESKQYVNDPGTTAVSGITIMSLTYTKS